MLFLHLDQDEFCGADKYGSWHQEFLVAMDHRQHHLNAGGQHDSPITMSWGQLSPYFWSYSLPGRHSGPLAQAFYGGDMEAAYTVTEGSFDIKGFFQEFLRLAIGLSALRLRS